MIKVKDGYAKLIGTTTTGSASHLLLSNGGVKAVSDFALKSDIPDVSKYLPLSGGKLLGELQVDARVELMNGQALEWTDTQANGSTSNLLLPRKNLNYRLDYYDGTNWHLLAYKTDIPTKTSQLTNDSGFLTSRGYIGTTAVLANSASQSLTGIADITMSGSVNTVLKATTSLGAALLNITEVTADTNYIHLYVSSLNSIAATTRALVLQNGYGNVGIGTTSPSERLHVNGTGRVDNIHLKSTYINLNRNGSNSAIYDSTKTALEIEATTDLSILRTYNVTTQTSIVLHKNGCIGIGTRTPTERLLVNGNIKIQGTSNTSTTPDIYLGYYTSWNGTSYPTLMSGHAGKWVMHLNPHIARHTGTDTPGANLRMESINKHYFDVSVGHDGLDTFKVRYDNSKNVLTISNTGQVNLINSIVFTGSVGASAGTYLAGTGTEGLFLAANESGKKVFLESTNQDSPWFRNKNGDYALLHSENWPTHVGKDGYVMRCYVIDARSLDNNTWYPVTMDLGWDGRVVRIEVRCYLLGNKPSWATHNSGFTTIKVWETNGYGWGSASGAYRTIYQSNSSWCDPDPVRGIGLMGNSNQEFVYVRGGGYYYFYTSHNTTPVLRTSTFSQNNESVGPTTSMPSGIGAFSTSYNMHASHFYEHSDIRFKDVEEDVNISPQQLSKLPLFNFKWNNKHDNEVHTGSSAQEVQKLLPTIVHENNNILTLDYGVLGTIAGITACRELTDHEKEINELKEQIKFLKDEINNLKTNKLWQS